MMSELMRVLFLVGVMTLAQEIDQLVQFFEWEAAGVPVAEYAWSCRAEPASVLLRCITDAAAQGPGDGKR